MHGTKSESAPPPAPQPPSCIVKNKSTPENRAFWEHVEKVSAEVQSSPEFKKHERAKSISHNDPWDDGIDMLPPAAPSPAVADWICPDCGGSQRCPKSCRNPYHNPNAPDLARLNEHGNLATPSDNTGPLPTTGSLPVQRLASPAVELCECGARRWGIVHSPKVDGDGFPDVERHDFQAASFPERWLGELFDALPVAVRERLWHDRNAFVKWPKSEEITAHLRAEVRKQHLLELAEAATKIEDADTALFVMAWLRDQIGKG